MTAAHLDGATPSLPSTFLTSDTPATTPLPSPPPPDIDNTARTHGIGLTALTGETETSPPHPLSTHSYAPKTIKDDLIAFRKNVENSKGKQKAHIKEQEKQCATRLKTQMIYGGVIAITFIGIVGAIIGASIAAGPLGGVLVAGVGLVAGSAIIMWATPKFMEATDAPKPADIRSSEAYLQTIKDALKLFEDTDKEDYSFQDFLNEEFSPPYNVSDLKDYMQLYSKKMELKGFEQESAQLEEETKRLQEETVANDDELNQQLSEKQEALTAHQQRVKQLKSNQKIWKRDFDKGMEDFKARDKKADAAEGKESAKSKAETPPLAEAWMDKRPPLTAEGKLLVKNWNVDLAASPSRTTPLYMLGNKTSAPPALSGDEQKHLEKHGFSQEYAFLSASDTSAGITIDGTPYKSPIHYVLQKMVAHDEDAAAEIAGTANAQDALDAAKRHANGKEFSNQEYKEYLQTNYEVAGRYLKRALFAKFAQDDGSPTVLGKKLMDTAGRELIATNEIGFEGWGWGAALSGDKTQINGPNLLGLYLTELRDWLLQQRAGIGAKPPGSNPLAGIGLAPGSIPQGSAPTPPHYNPPTAEEEAARIAAGAPPFPTSAPPSMPKDSLAAMPPSSPPPTFEETATTIPHLTPEQLADIANVPPIPDSPPPLPDSDTH